VANWDILEAQQVLRHLTPVARSAGYVLSMYGSVLTEMSGNDLDVIACPFREGCEPRQLRSALIQRLMLPVHIEPQQRSFDHPGVRCLRGMDMSGNRVNIVIEVPFSRIFRRGWLWRKIDVVVYPNLRP
jgi:hypothetical protein